MVFLTEQLALLIKVKAKKAEKNENKRIDSPTEWRDHMEFVKAWLESEPSKMRKLQTHGSETSSVRGHENQQSDVDADVRLVVKKFLSEWTASRNNSRGNQMPYLF